MRIRRAIEANQNVALRKVAAAERQRADGDVSRLAHSILPKFELKPGEVFKGIVIRLSKKAGRLQLRVLDTGTNELIKGITFEMCSGDHQADRGYCIWGSAQGDYHEFVVADAPKSIKVSAPRYQDKARKSSYITLAPGENRTVKIELQRSTTT